MYFVIVVVGTFVGQIALTHYLPGLTRTTSLTLQEWGLCILVGSTSLGIAALLKLFKQEWTDKIKMDKMVDENKSENSGLLSAYNKSKNIKATDFIKKKGGNDNEDDDFVNVK